MLIVDGQTVRSYLFLPWSCERYCVIEMGAEGWLESLAAMVTIFQFLKGDA